MNPYERLKLNVEILSDGKNTIILDNQGLPSVMVKIPKFNISDVINGGQSTPHPAFIVNGEIKDFIYISKYQNIVENGLAYSLPHKEPNSSLTFDQAKACCEAKGTGWHLMTNAEWMAIALWCKKNNLLPRGNNNYGMDSIATNEKGYLSDTLDSTLRRKCKVYAGSGVVAWSHDGTNNGIYDLNGNLWEWIAGLRSNKGEINIIPDNNAAVTGSNQNESSELWKSITFDGTLETPGTIGVLKYGTNIQIAVNFGSITSNGNISPMISKVLGVYPTGIDPKEKDAFVISLSKDTYAVRGGSFRSNVNGQETGVSGIFALNFNYPRSTVLDYVGFRCAYIE